MLALTTKQLLLDSLVILIIAQQCNILLASCSHNFLSEMIVVLSQYCCRNLAFILTNKPIFSAQINAYASPL